MIPSVNIRPGSPDDIEAVNAVIEAVWRVCPGWMCSVRNEERSGGSDGFRARLGRVMVGMFRE